MWYTSQMLFARKGSLAHPKVLYENESLQYCLSYDITEMATFLLLETWFFHRVQFLQGLSFLRSRVRDQVQFLDNISIYLSII